MYERLKGQGLEILAFPCNQFGGQEPWAEPKIKEFVSQYPAKFPMFSKIEVNGANTHPIYQWLKKSLPGDVTWNFESKFIVNRDGIPVKRFSKDEFSTIEAYIVEQLKIPAGSESKPQSSISESNSNIENAHSSL